MDDYQIMMMKLQALDFINAYDRLWPSQGKEIPIGKPALICAALALEIGIKSVLAEKKTSYKHLKGKKGHDLFELLKLLPSEIKTKPLVKQKRLIQISIHN